MLKPEFLRDDDPGGPKRVSRQRGTLYSRSHNALGRKARGTKKDQRTMKFLLFFIRKWMKSKNKKWQKPTAWRRQWSHWGRRKKMTGKRRKIHFANFLQCWEVEFHERKEETVNRRAAPPPRIKQLQHLGPLCEPQAAASYKGCSWHLLWRVKEIKK